MPRFAATVGVLALAVGALVAGKLTKDAYWSGALVNAGVGLLLLLIPVAWLSRPLKLAGLPEQLDRRLEKRDNRDLDRLAELRDDADIVLRAVRALEQSLRRIVNGYASFDTVRKRRALGRLNAKTKELFDAWQLVPRLQSREAALAAAGDDDNLPKDVREAAASLAKVLRSYGENLTRTRA